MPGLNAVMQDQAVGLRVVAELETEQVGDLALVPAQEWTDAGQAGHRAVRWATPLGEGRLARQAGDIAQFKAVGLGVPGIDHLHASTVGKQLDCHCLEVLPVQGQGLLGGHGCTPANAWAATMKWSHRRPGHHRPSTSSGASASHIGAMHQPLTRSMDISPLSPSLAAKYMARK